jgi:hypothetical protein
MSRSYPLYSQPLWRRLLLTREFAVIALLGAVVLYALGNVRNFDGPLTVTYLLLDVAPILLIALPMTLVIVSGEIDLSVAQRGGTEQRAGRACCTKGGPAVARRPDFSRCWPERCAAPSTASSWRYVGCRRWP